MTHNEPQISVLSEDALVLQFSRDPDTELQNRLWHLSQLIRDSSDGRQHLLDIVPGPGNLMLRLHPGSTLGMTGMTELVEALWQDSARQTASQRLIRIPVVYGGKHGPDLAAVARHCRLREEDVIKLHSNAEYRVVCIGFQPGFPYLTGLDPRLSTPRRKTPRTRIPAGSVAIGGTQTGIYPAASPGGWQIIGHTSTRLFDPESDSPCLLQPGDSVCFVPEPADD